ncbi:hypothetical protein A3G55_02900 [Candidatus Giovannonibacteria bacterium RIFCSPLOWO2_12_FULL_44_25]|uniref:Uncharacterized protein n=3 Tax=Candidatus Giovannoniibacteriota TaxID=1752738 RepID=A0A0G1I9H3_9BACT|nr:MAG: hypothetical protein UW15_C0023G0003 [Parcubacteria group bacterium GW2011_GWC1_44_10]KKT55860.1 MAG: hypothetical protein UW49_C0019G0005 [Candidatus Giovannonibacteria bacterium GW2011_GWB1_44_23]KKT59374.1 MAG: hypothetical protein UW53_C0014G0008 [Candidatus Giovannonibacteria bacterium GW2011_GWA1_44_25]OGF49564.1 MAG: hypothetical protein A2120_01165 [Candidatus Giovannonibacteria bacterium GWA2_45_15]OGF60235.1 MAG: hypothetical protein A2656_00190 [Candidatus Giovannonibacteria 
MTISNESLYKAAQWCIIAMAFLLPVWFLPTTAAPVEFNKELMVAMLVFLSLILYLAYSIKSGSVSFPYHKIFIVMGLLLLSWLASASVAGTSSAFWGLGAEPNGFFAFLTLFLMSIMIMLLFSEALSLYRLILAFASGLIIFSLAAWIFSVFGFGQLIGGLFQSRFFNPIGSWNSAGFASGFLIMLVYPFLLSSSGKFKWIIAALSAASLILIFLVNFPLIWGVIGFFAVLLLAYAIWKKHITFASMGVPLILLILALFAFFFSNLVAEKIVPTAPLEVGVSHRTTLDVVGKALRENMFFGTGPNSFGYLWDKYKPTEVNFTPFWGFRFNIGSSYLFTVLGEIGILGWLIYVVFLGWLWYLGIGAVAKEADIKTNVLSLSAFLVFSYTILTWALYAAPYTLVAFGFLSLGILLANIRRAGHFHNYEISFTGAGPRGFISALVIVFFIIAGVVGIYFAAVRYMGQFAYARGLDSFNRLGNLDAAEKQMLLAVQSSGSNDLYLRSLSQIYMSKAQLLLQDRSASPEILGSKFKDFLDKSVLASQNAVKTAPKDFMNYRSLGKIYEFLIQLNAAGALEAAETQYDEALKRSPGSPLIWRDKAVSYLADLAVRKNQDSLKKAEEALLKAVELKPDYAEGHFLLAQIYDAQGKTTEAIKRGEAAAFLAQNDIGTLFQLGLLYYQVNRLSDAEVVFGRAVSINVNYSNARYFLGLIYSRTNRSSAAIAEFEKIAALNPDNTEVKIILTNLRAGKSALSGIVPPAASPEKRNEPPVKDR